VYLLLAGVIGLVLIACANISNLFMSRTAEQQRQLAIHAAVGATKRKLFSTIVAETGLLMVISVILALIIATVGFFVMQLFLAQKLPRVDELAVNWVTLTSAAAISAMLALFFAGLSSRMINYRALNATLQSSGKGTGVQVSKKIRKLLIMSQVAVVTSLVFVNISLFKDSITTINQDLGFNTHNLMSITFANSSAVRPERETRKQLMNEVREQLAALPQVEKVAQGRAPLNGFNIWATTVPNSNERYTPEAKEVDHNYFQMINQQLIEGDFFKESDIKDEAHVVIVNDILAKRLAPTGSAVGLKIAFSDDPLTIIGVVKGIQIPGETEVPIRAYVPASLADNEMVIQLKPNATISREQVVTVLSEVTSQYNIFAMELLNTQKSQLLFTQYTTAITSAVLAVLTFFLAAIGLYGILSYSTHMRRFEIGTRLAIGAKRFDLISLIIKDNLASITLGMVLSLVILVILYLGFSEQLADYVNVTLISLFAITITLISLVSLFACYWPLRPFINRPAIYSLRGNE
jgi:ABC-type antimicrobial peptide transport system permease subunit